MAQSTGIILAAGTITLANEAVFSPVASGGSITSSFNWRIVPATIGLALAMGGLEKLAPKFAIGLSYLVLASVFLVRTGNAPTPLENALKAMGYKTS